MPRQKQEKNGTGICHVMQGKESKTCPSDSLQIILESHYTEENEYIYFIILFDTVNYFGYLYCPYLSFFYSGI